MHLLTSKQAEVRRGDVVHYSEHIWSSSPLNATSNVSWRSCDPAQRMVGKSVIFMKHPKHAWPPLADRYKGRLGIIKEIAGEGRYNVSFEQASASKVAIEAHHLVVIEYAD